jgi:hypothetical protein
LTLWVSTGSEVPEIIHEFYRTALGAKRDDARRASAFHADQLDLAEVAQPG